LRANGRVAREVLRAAKAMNSRARGSVGRAITGVRCLATAGVDVGRDRFVIHWIDLRRREGGREGREGEKGGRGEIERERRRERERERERDLGRGSRDEWTRGESEDMRLLTEFLFMLRMSVAIGVAVRGRVRRIVGWSLGRGADHRNVRRWHLLLLLLLSAVPFPLSMLIPMPPITNYGR
jgi:hypothetical protein